LPIATVDRYSCASCGLTRAAAALCHGQLAVATAHNLAAIPLALVLAAVFFLVVWEAITQRPVLRPLWTRYATVLAWSAVAVFLAAWIVNLAHHFQSAPVFSLPPGVLE